MKSKERGDNRKVILRFFADELFADISTRCTLAANAATAAGRNVQHDVSDVLDDGNRELMTNTVSRLLFECMSILYPFCKTPVRRCHRNGTDDNMAQDADAYEIELDFPYERSETEVQLLKHCVNSYIVYKCVAEWLAATLPDTGQWQTWEQKAQEARDELATALVLPLRPRRMRVRPHFY